MSDGRRSEHGWLPVPVKRHWGEPGHTVTLTRLTGHTGAHGQNGSHYHTDEPHSHPSPPTHPHSTARRPNPARTDTLNKRFKPQPRDARSRRPLPRTPPRGRLRRAAHQVTGSGTVKCCLFGLCIIDLTCLEGESPPAPRAESVNSKLNSKPPTGLQTVCRSVCRPHKGDVGFVSSSV